jgi:hypothetical protein
MKLCMGESMASRGQKSLEAVYRTAAVVVRTRFERVLESMTLALRTTPFHWLSIFSSDSQFNLVLVDFWADYESIWHHEPINTR